MGHEVVLYKGKHAVLEERALYLALGFASKYSRDLLHGRIDNPRLRGLLDHWQNAVKSSLPDSAIELEERLSMPEDAFDLAAVLTHAEERVRQFGEVVPAELCNDIMELQGTPAAFQGGFKTE